LDGEYRFDIKFKGKDTNKNTIAIFVDTKNYSGTSQIFKDLRQIKAYFNKISSFEEFKIVQQNRPGVSLSSLQNAFQKCNLKRS
jgi:hypothetical protein